MNNTRKWTIAAIGTAFFVIVPAVVGPALGPNDTESAQAVADDLAAVSDKEFCAAMDRYPVRLKSGHLVCREMPGVGS